MRARDRLALLIAGVAFGGAVLAMTATSDSAMEARLRGILTRDVAAPCTFDACSFSFLEGFEVQGLTVLDPHDPLGPPLMKVGEARIDYNLGLLGGGPHLTRVHLWAPELRLVRADDGAFPLLRVLGRETDVSGDKVALPPIEVHGGTLVLGDPAILAAGQTVTLTSIDLRLSPGADTPDFSVRGRAVADLAGPIALEANLTEWGRRASVGVDVEDARIAPGLGDRLGGRVAQLVRDLEVAGAFRARLDLELEGDEILALTGEATFRDGALRVGLPETREGEPAPAPLTLDGIHGRVAMRDGALWLLGLDGRIEGAPFHVDGSVDVGLPSGPPRADGAGAVDVNATVDGLRVDAETARRLPWSVRRVQQAYTFDGLIDADLTIRGPLDAPGVDVDATIVAATAAYAGYVDPVDGTRQGFPYVAEGLNGTLSLRGSEVSFEATGQHGPTQIHVDGWADASRAKDKDTDVTITATDIAIDDDVRDAFGDRAESTLGPWNPSGVAKRVTVRATRVKSIDGERTAIDVEIDLDGRAAMHPDMLPTPLGDVSGRIGVLEPAQGNRRVPVVEVENLSATGDGFTVSATGKVVGAGDALRESLRITAEVERLDGALRDAVARSSRAPRNIAEVLERLDPLGRATLVLALEGTSQERADRLTIDMRGVSVRGGEDIPLRVSDLRGRVVFADDSLSGEGVAGQALGAPFEASGRWDELSAATPRITFDVRAEDLPVGPVLRDDLGRLIDDARELWDDLAIGANARADVELSLRPDGVEPRPVTLTVRRFRGDVRPLGLDTVVTRGDLDFDGRRAVVSFDGTLGAGELKVKHATYDVGSGHLTADVSARGLEAPECFAPALPERVLSALREATPGRFVHVPAAQVTWDPARDMLTIVGDLSIRPRQRNAQEGLRAEGTFHFERLDVHVPPTGAPTFTGAALVEQVTFHPGLAFEDVRGRLEFRGALDSDGIQFAADVSDAALLAGGFEFTEARFGMDVKAPRVALQNISAKVFGGDLTGSFSSGLEKVAFRGRMELVGADLREIAPGRGEEKNEGFLDGVVQFRNPSGNAGDLVGQGSVRLRDGKVLRVPVLTTVLNAIDTATLGAGVRGHFREGGMRFDLRGDELQIEDLQLSGPEMPDPLPGSLGLRNGRGRVSLADQRVDVLVEPRIGLGMLALDPTGVVTGILNAAQWFLLRELRVEGTLRNPQAAWQFVPRGGADELRPRPQPAGDLRPYGEPPW